MSDIIGSASFDSNFNTERALLSFKTEMIVFLLKCIPWFSAIEREVVEAVCPITKKIRYSHANRSLWLCDDVYSRRCFLSNVSVGED